MEKLYKLVLLLLLVGSILVGEVSAQTGDLPRSTPEEQGVSSKAVHTYFDSLMALPNTEIHGVMVMRHGKVIGEFYPEPFKAEYQHTMYSCSKTFVSAAIGLAIAENRLSLNDRVAPFFAEYLPDTISDNLAAMTIHDLLIMGSGITPSGRLRVENGEWIKNYLGKHVKEPSAAFEYDSMCTYLLAAILQKVMGVNVLEYLQVKLFNEMNITQADWEISAEGYITGGWGMHIQCETMAKFGQLLLNKGEWNGKQLLTESWVEQMLTGHVKFRGRGYGYQLWLCEYPNTYRCDGAFGQYILLMPDQDMVVAITECTMGSGVPQRRLVWDLIFPTLTDSPKKATSEYSKLVKAQKGYKFPVIKGSATSPISSSVIGKRMVLADNRLGWSTIEFTTVGGELKLRVYTTDNDCYDVVCGNGEWITTWIDANPPYSVRYYNRYNGLDGKFAVAASYGWVDKSKLDVKLHYVNWISSLLLKIDFDSNEIEIKENYSAQPFKVKIL